MTIKTCFFDMGNVLVHFSHEQMCLNVSEVCKVPVESATEWLLHSGLQIQLECGQITEQQFHTAIEARAEKDIDFADLKQAAADIFHLNESMVPLLDELKSGGLRLVLLSNTSLTHLRFIQQTFDVLDRFDDLTTSFQTGALKPDAAIYLDALSRAQAAPEECFYTDDIEDYVVRAREFRIHAEVYTDTALTRRALRNLGVSISAT